jgi:UDP:flavonoid glycosyltransferase YjiC (YdhE family)
MRIGIQTWGSTGDIRPFLALAGELQKAGHDVTLAITSVDSRDYTLLAQALNIKLRSVGEKLLEYSAETYEQLKFALTRERMSLKQLKIILDYFFEHCHRSFPRIPPLCCSRKIRAAPCYGYSQP